jgi:TonB family protein
MIQTILSLMFLALFSCSSKPSESQNFQELGLHRDQIANTISENQSDTIKCYEKALKTDGTEGGRLVVAFVINGAGLVKSAQVSESTLKSKDFDNCIVEKLKSWKFPRPVGGADVEVKYPFRFVKGH